MGDLVLVYKRISGLAGHTSRVSELLESVNRLSSGDPVETRRELYLRNLSSGNLRDKLDENVPKPARHMGEIIKFHRCLKPCLLDSMPVALWQHESPPGWAMFWQAHATGEVVNLPA